MEWQLIGACRFRWDCRTLASSAWPRSAALSLTITSIGLSKPSLMTYIYRADGLRSSLITSASPGTFAWTYTSAGRELTQSDPNTGRVFAGGRTLAPRTFTYDAYGRVNTEQMPADTTPSGQAGYDAEGELLYFAPVTQYNTGYTYSTRGELGGPLTASASYFYVNTMLSTIGYYANGATCQTLPAGNQTSPGNTGSCTYDARSSALLSTVYNIQATQNGQPVTEHMAHAYAYDAAGRESNDTSTWGSVIATSPRTYDADNHVLQQILPVGYVPGNPTFEEDSAPTTQYAMTNGYLWGPDGRLVQKVDTVVENGTFTSYLTYGWDGDSVLYQYDGSKVYLYIEKLAFADAAMTDFTVYDRDYTETAVQEHDSAGAGPRNDDPAQRSCLTKACQKYRQNVESRVMLSTGGLEAVRVDGYTDGTNVFQGARAYDPNSAQWTAPDAYAGDVHDPMSQKPYMWNRNNPVAYSDPSGYEAGCVSTGPPCISGQAADAIGKALVSLFDALFGHDLRTVGDSKAPLGDRLLAGLSLATAVLPIGKAGKAVELTGGILSETQFLDRAIQFLGKGAREVSPGRYLSADGMRQVRFGVHEFKDPNKLHGHFEVYDKPASQNGAVTEKSTVKIVPDPH